MNKILDSIGSVVVDIVVAFGIENYIAYFSALIEFYCIIILKFII